MSPRFIFLGTVPVLCKRLLTCQGSCSGIVLFRENRNEGTLTGTQLDAFEETEASVLLYHRFDGPQHLGPGSV